VAACRRLGRRAALLTQDGELVPADLPAGIRRFGFVPLSRVLSRAAGLVHHGGIGTGALALAAGLPQLVVPSVIDQPDNAARLERLGVAMTLRPREYRGPRVADALRRLLDSSQVRSRCRATAEKFRSGEPLEDACRWVERLAG
jgi:UDP:flavonoid glycosyltransferase YjiC (YdhE family)